MKRFILLLLACSTALAAQDTRPVVAVLPFEAIGTDSEETRTIEKLVQSYISQLPEFRIVSQEDRDKVLSEKEFQTAFSDGIPSASLAGLLSAQYLLSGSVGVIGEERVLTLQVTKIKTGEKRSVSIVRKSMSELALGTRALVLEAFLKAEEPSATATAGPSAEATLKEEDIVGSWAGDKGIELVRVFRGGKAVAVLSSGVQMELRYTIEAGTVRFVQTSPNTPRFYHPVPYSIALALVKEAEPMEWIFGLYDTKSVLRGQKKATAIVYEGDKIKTIVRGATRDAEWLRPTR